MPSPTDEANDALRVFLKDVFDAIEEACPDGTDFVLVAFNKDNLESAEVRSSTSSILPEVFQLVLARRALRPHPGGEHYRSGDEFTKPF